MPLLYSPLRIVLLCFAALSGDMSKLLLAAKKIRRATCTEFLISLVADDFSRPSNTYIGKLRLVQSLFGPYLLWLMHYSTVHLIFMQ